MQLANLVVLLATVRSSCSASGAPACLITIKDGCRKCLDNFKEIDYLLALQANQDADQVTQSFNTLGIEQADAINATGADLLSAYNTAQGAADPEIALCISIPLVAEIPDVYGDGIDDLEGLTPALNSAMITADSDIDAAFAALGSLPSDAAIVAELLDYSSDFWTSVQTALDDALTAMNAAGTTANTNFSTGITSHFSTALSDATSCIGNAFITFNTAISGAITSATAELSALLASISANVQSCLMPLITATNNRTIETIRFLMASCSGGMSPGPAAL